MAIRVSSVHLQVLHTGKQQLEMASVSQYQHAYTSFEMAPQADYAIFIGANFETVFAAHYGLAGFTELESTILQPNYNLTAFNEFENVIGQGVYTINVLVGGDQHSTHAYELNAFIISDGQHYGNYDLNAFEPSEQVFHSQYDLDVFLLANGFSQGLYNVEVFVDLLMQAVSSYDILSFGQVDAPVLSQSYELDAEELREQVFRATYALNVFTASTGFLDTDHQLEVFKALELRYGIHWDLAAFQQLNGFGDSNFAIEVLVQADAKFGAAYDLFIFQALDGFGDAAYLLNAYQQADGFTDADYGISIFVANTGFGDASYLLEALAAKTGAFNGTYLLDTFQELFTWVINQNTGAPARYEAYGFDAFAVMGQNYLGALGDGIYLLDGDDDQGTDIDAIATIANTNLDEPNLKRVTGAYLGVHASGQVHLTLRTDQGITSGPYRLRQSPDAQTTERAKFTRGIRSHYWQADMENTAGEDVKIDSLELEAEIVTRRLKK